MMMKKRLLHTFIQEEIMKKKWLQNQRDIPFEIQEVIMKRLPVKSLIRFRSVSKPWKSLIDSSGFVRDYRSQTNHLLVQYRDPESDYARKYVSIVDDDTFPQQKFSLTTVGPISVDLLYNPTIVGSSCGLFCVYDNNINRNNGKPSNSGTIVLWNPSVGKSVVIDVPNVLDWPYRTAVGFAVCPRTRDPKFVKFSFIISLDFDIGIPFQVEVFTLNSGVGVWRTPLSIKVPRRSISLTLNYVVIGGVIYWLSHDNFRVCNYVIISFDITSEEFTEIYLPERLSSCFDVGLSISKLRESLVVIEYNYDTWNHIVWMTDHGDPNSFTKLFNIKTNIPDVITEKVLGFKKNGEPIIEILMNNSNDYEEIHSALFVYDPGTKSINNIGISGLARSFFEFLHENLTFA